MRNRSNALPVLALGACVLVASPAFAQQARPGEVMGLRYLTWAGKPDAPTAPSDGLRRSNAAGPPTPLAASGARYPGIQNASARPSRYGVGSGAGLTPASAWTGSSRTPAPPPTPLAQAPTQEAPAPRGPIPVYSAPQPPQAHPAEQARAQAAYQAQIQAQYQAWYQSEAQAQYEAQVRAMPQPQQQTVRMQAPAAGQAQQPTPLQQRADAGAAPAATSDYDPMAPRRDAPIFRMQQPQAQTEAQPQPQQPAASTQTNAQGEIQSSVLTQPVAGRTPGGQAYAGAEPPREGVRYYSVQRAVGRQPDPIAMPESVYLDNAPIDLAEPPANPVRTRTVNGQAQVVVPNQDPNLP